MTSTCLTSCSLALDKKICQGLAPRVPVTAGARKLRKLSDDGARKHVLETDASRAARGCFSAKIGAIDRWQYLLVLLGSLAAVVPLEFALGLRVLRDPIRLVRTLWLPVVLFVLWDVLAIERGTWWYNERYVTGWRLPFGLPLEELAFFIVIPVVGLLTFEAVRRVLGQRGG
jgi:lycopene cyclase domain-containing protein